MRAFFWVMPIHPLYKYLAKIVSLPIRTLYGDSHVPIQELFPQLKKSVFGQETLAKPSAAIGNFPSIYPNQGKDEVDERDLEYYMHAQNGPEPAMNLNRGLAPRVLARMKCFKVYAPGTKSLSL
jgi:hypothetical protein